MKYTFEITICGCATNCGHCYVDGGPGPAMSYEDYVLCLSKLVPALEKLNGEISLNLGNETFCHPRVAELFRLTDRVCPQFFDRRGEDFPTTGIALFRHRDRENILRELERKGINELFFAVHGGKHAHDLMVQRTDRFDQLFETADFLVSRGFQVGFSLMLSRVFAQGLDEVMARIACYPGAKTYPIIPLYAPTPRLRQYQQHRLEKQELLHLCKKLEVWGVHTEKIRHLCEECSEQAIWSGAKDFSAERAAAPNWAFFHVTHDLRLYYGNAGMHTRYLGDLRQMTPLQVFEAIAPLGANYDFDAFYPMACFDLLHQIPRPATDRVFSSRPDCYYAWLDQLGVPNLLIK